MKPEGTKSLVGQIPFVSMGYITVGIENCVLTAYLIVVAGTREFIQLLPSGNLT